MLLIEPSLTNLIGSNSYKNPSKNPLFHQISLHLFFFFQEPVYKVEKPIVSS